MKTANELAREFPEQNPLNLEHDAVIKLNDWGIEAVAMLRSQAAEVESLRKANIIARDAAIELEQAIADERANHCGTCKNKNDVYDEACAICCNFYAITWGPKP